MGSSLAHTDTSTILMGRARWAVAFIFALNGMIFAAWVARIPQIQRELDLSEGALGLVLLGMPLGLLAALPLIGNWIHRWHSRPVTIAGALVYCAILPLLGLAPHAVVLWLVLFAFGMSTGAMDIAMNAQAVEVERLYKRSIMSSFHAAFSVGGFIGAGLSSLLISLGLTKTPHLVLMATMGIVSLWLVRRFLIPTDTPSEDVHVSVFSLPPRVLLPLGIIAFCSSVGEGAMADWSTVYMRRVVETSPSTAALGFAAFSLLMTIGRATGDKIIQRFGRVTVVRAGGTIAACGFMVAVLFPYTLSTIAGFALVGTGLSFIIPIVFSAAGNTPGISAGRGIAGVATLGYGGFLAGAPLIGLVAEVTSLRVSLAVVAVLALTLVPLAQALRIAEHPTPSNELAETTT